MTMHALSVNERYNMSPKKKREKNWEVYENAWPLSHDKWKLGGWHISKYFVPIATSFSAYNQQEGRRTHIQITTQCEFVMDHNKYMCTHHWS